ncbi:MAG: heavy-metal-associated domain-containing protein [Bacteroidia bacterium]|jgi:copper chaperone
MKYQFKTNINCGNCIASVTPFLNQIDEIESWKVDTDNPQKILSVELEDGVDAQIIVETVSKAGFRIEPA